MSAGDKKNSWKLNQRHEQNIFNVWEVPHLNERPAIGPKLEIVEPPQDIELCKTTRIYQI